ncbi:MAG TPA: hypothetical protein VFO89_17580, partial [Thermoanaerobaculia bacterium]|nr:hypothetical protein [Thermoanaerobaculia bacterium]
TISLLVPPTASAESVCNTYPNSYPAYYDDCGCMACGGWSLWSCTECVDTSDGGACWTRGPSCLPIPQYQ